MIIISIHALTKRATNDTPDTRWNTKISIHALTKRATSFIHAPIPLPLDFNPRSHEESDKEEFINKYGSDIISIHALTKRATFRRLSTDRCTNISIHALTKRATDSS